MADRLPCDTPLIVGAAGAAAATKELDAVDAELVPAALVATTVQVYVLALVNELTVMGELAPEADCVVPALLDAQVTV
jgi:hypothetical protein